MSENLTDKMPSFNMLLACLEKARSIMGFGVPELRRMPAEFRSAIEHLQVSSYRNTDKGVTAVTTLKKHVADVEFIRGAGLRDRGLVAHAATLESLRAVLPELAAKAMMELGRVARELHNEGSTGEPR